MSIEVALDLAGPLLAAWDRTEPAWLGIYQVGPAGAWLRAFRRLTPEDRLDTTTRLLSLPNVRVGSSAGGNEHVWVTDGRGFAAWSRRTCTVTASSIELDLGGWTIHRRSVIGVTSFLDRADLGHRGVRVEFTGRAPFVVAEERDAAALLDPTYNIDNVMMDASWATLLGRDLATFLAVPHRDELP